MDGDREELLHDEDGAACRALGAAPQHLEYSSEGGWSLKFRGKKRLPGLSGEQPRACSGPLEPYQCCRFGDIRPGISVSRKVCIIITDSSQRLLLKGCGWPGRVS